MFEDLKQRGEQLVAQARHRAHLARGEGRARLFLVEAQALERLDGLLEAASELPLVGPRVATPVARALQTTVERRTLPDLQDYDQLNAKAAARAVRELDHLGLIKVRRHEAANKGRKTVLDAVERQLQVLSQPPQRSAA